MSARDTARDVGLLIRYALARDVPARHETYGALLDRYVTDPHLRDIANETITGMGMRVLAADRMSGLVVSAEPGSPFAADPRRNDSRLKISGTAAERMIYGVALAGIAAYFYPNAQALNDSASRRGTAIDVDRLIREHAAAIRSGDIFLDDGLGEAWAAYEERKHVELTAGGALRRSCTVWKCEEAFGLLADFGLVVGDRTAKPPRDDLGVWRATDRFRAHVADAGGPLAWQALATSGVPEQVISDIDTEDDGEDGVEDEGGEEGGR